MTLIYFHFALFSLLFFTLVTFRVDLKFLQHLHFLGFYADETKNDCSNMASRKSYRNVVITKNIFITPQILTCLRNLSNWIFQLENNLVDLLF